MRCTSVRTSGHPLAGLVVGVPEPREGVLLHRVDGSAAAVCAERLVAVDRRPADGRSAGGRAARREASPRDGRREIPPLEGASGTTYSSRSSSCRMRFIVSFDFPVPGRPPVRDTSRTGSSAAEPPAAGPSSGDLPGTPPPRRLPPSALPPGSADPRQAASANAWEAALPRARQPGTAGGRRGERRKPSVTGCVAGCLPSV